MHLVDKYVDDGERGGDKSVDGGVMGGDKSAGGEGDFWEINHTTVHHLNVKS